MRGVPWPMPGRLTFAAVWAAEVADAGPDELASDVSYAAATVAVQRRGDEHGRVGPPWSATQLAGTAVTAAAPYIARDLLRELALTPWWRRGRRAAELLAQAEVRVREQGAIR